MYSHSFISRAASGVDGWVKEKKRKVKKKCSESSRMRDNMSDKKKDRVRQTFKKKEPTMMNKEKKMEGGDGDGR